MLQTIIRRPRKVRPAVLIRAVHTATALLFYTSVSVSLVGCGGGNGGDDGNDDASPTPIATVTPTAPTPTPAPAGNLVPPYVNKVAFISRRNAEERDQLYVMNPDGSQVTEIRPLANFSSLRLKYPGNHFMSADGATFVLTFDIGTGAGASTYLVNADGSNRRDITGLLDPSATNGGTVGQVSDIAMNANGSQLVFPYTNNRNANGTFIPNASPTLVTMSADGSGRTTRYTAPTDQEIFSPIFAPDGQTLYFIQAIQSDSGDDFATTGTIYRLAPGTKTPTIVTTFTTRGAGRIVVFPQISISPDGTKLAFDNYVDGSSNEIFVVNTDGTGLTRLTTNTSVDTYPAFTIDGVSVIFQSYRDGNSEIYRVNPDGTGEARLTYDIEVDAEPATRARKTAASATKKEMLP